jgi:hypothetical protein
MNLNELIRELSAIRAVNGGNFEVFDTDAHPIISANIDHETGRVFIESEF